MRGKLKEALSRSVLVGSFQCIRDPNMPGLFARAGFDLVVIDTEHFYLNPESVQSIVLGARAAGIFVLVRPAEISRSAIQRALDAAPDGILVPLVSTREEAAQVVEFARYAPLGSRGFHGLTPATGWGERGGAEHAANDTQQTLVAVQIETPAGVENCEAIARVEGIDMLFVGPGDLSHALGRTGDYSNPELLSGVDHALAAARESKKLSGIYAARPHLEERARGAGATFIVRGSDTRFFLDGASAARGAR